MLPGNRRTVSSEEPAGEDERQRLDAAVKKNDSPFPVYLVSPWSKYVARFAARRGWAPNAVTLFSFALGVAAAGAFAAGSRGSLIAGAFLLQASFVFDCVDGQLARFSRRFSSIGPWLDTACDRAKEYLVYAGLALGSTRGFGNDVWLLAACALALQTVRHLSDFAWVAVRPPGGADGYGASAFVRRANQLIRLPIGERLALISLTAAVASPSVTFIALLAWGGLGLVLALAVRLGITYSVRPVGAR
jgi:phosphatidylglycerophosphate synthase